MTLPPGGVLTPFKPTLPNPGDFVEIAAAGNHTCARKYSGDVLCWGAEGEAGYGKVIMTPTLAFSGATKIAVGAAHACALNSAGAAYCWGGGEEGQLGVQIGAQIGYGSGWVLGPKDPNSYYGTLAPLSFSSITASGGSTCGIASSGLYCWGLAGSVNPQGFTSIPTLIVTPNGYSPNFTQIAIGNQHVCGFVGQEMDCWGADVYGQAGEDPASAFYYPNSKFVMVAMGTSLNTGVKRISAEGDFTCADMIAGSVQCVGYDYDGELGNAPGSFTWLPQAVGGGMALRGVAAGSKHACALDGNNEAWCWGYNYWGMVGNGTWSYNTPSAQKVLGVSTGYHVNGAAVQFKALAAGSEHTCGIGFDNHIYCWGHNSSRQLGTWLVDANGQSLTYGWVSSPVQVI
jgi:alpha-tubulin suppressor-like RCC1 family protein